MSQIDTRYLIEHRLRHEVRGQHGWEEAVEDRKAWIGLTDVGEALSDEAKRLLYTNSPVPRVRRKLWRLVRAMVFIGLVGILFSFAVPYPYDSVGLALSIGVILIAAMACLCVDLSFFQRRRMKQWQIERAPAVAEFVRDHPAFMEVLRGIDEQREMYDELVRLAALYDETQKQDVPRTA